MHLYSPFTTIYLEVYEKNSVDYYFSEAPTLPFRKGNSEFMQNFLQDIFKDAE